MSKQSASARFTKIFSYAGIVVVALLVVLFIASDADHPGGPVVESAGLVRSVGYMPTDGPTLHIASIQLASGEVVQARIDPGVYVKVESTVRVKAYRRIISRRMQYRIEIQGSAK